MWNLEIHQQKVYEYRGFLWMLLTTRKYERIPYLERKLLKLIVDDAKHNYPNQWPSLMDDLFNLQSVTARIALEALKSVIEEFMAARGVGFQRGCELKQNIIGQREPITNFLLQCLSAYLDAATPLTSKFTSPVSASPTLSTPDQVVFMTSDSANAIIALEIITCLIHGIDDDFKTYPPMMNCITTLLNVSGNDEWNNTCAHFLTELFMKPGRMGDVDIAPIARYVQKVANNIVVKGIDSVDKHEKALEIMENMVKNHFELLKRTDLEVVQALFSSYFDYTLLQEEESLWVRCLGVWETVAEKSLGCSLADLVSGALVKLIERMLLDHRLFSQVDTSNAILDFIG